ncbi:hypothetical protein QEH56_23830 [Pelagicoccus enzymogenes]|uniref:hypothetical protein n=1 Tax=Pelagicoccus enzymogenes TaxID=2773457 RepID=UPI00280DBA15|nr:hypothetical protein [Pelagicoccus enzymogenes]MDQ8201216.1 hypothetical protein [Pelagicoccus enzymogenes]
MLLRYFNKTGIKRFISYRDELARNKQASPPREMLEDNNLTIQLDVDVEIELRDFSNRREAGEYLCEIVSKSGLERPESNVGLWSWLTLFFIDQVCPPDSKGNRTAYAFERLVPKVDDYQKFYRHLLLGPYLLVRAYENDISSILAVLCNPVYKPGEIVGQLASRKELFSNKSVLKLATCLYYDEEKGSFVRGAGSDKKGAPRRLAKVLNQLELTYYLHGMSDSEIGALLPKEFDRFKNRPDRSAA